MINRKLLLKKRPLGLPEEDTWELIDEKIPNLTEGEILIEQEYISVSYTHLTLPTKRIV